MSHFHRTIHIIMWHNASICRRGKTRDETPTKVRKNKPQQTLGISNETEPWRGCTRWPAEQRTKRRTDGATHNKTVADRQRTYTRSRHTSHHYTSILSQWSVWIAGLIEMTWASACKVTREHIAAQMHAASRHDIHLHTLARALVLESGAVV